MLAQEANQVRQCRLGRIRGAGEHGFAVEHPTDGDAIEPAREVPVVPGLDTVREAAPMQAAIGFHHLRGNPCALTAGAGRCAFLDDALERAIESHREPPPPQGLCE